MSSQNVKMMLHESIENIDDNDFLNTVKQIIDRKYSANENIILANWQINRIEESHQQIEQGKKFTNHQANLLVEKWLNE